MMAVMMDHGMGSKLAGLNPNVKGVSFTRNYGKSAALDMGFSRTGVVVVMDADLQDSRMKSLIV